MMMVFTMMAGVVDIIDGSVGLDAGVRAALVLEEDGQVHDIAQVIVTVDVRIAEQARKILFDTWNESMSSFLETFQDKFSTNANVLFFENI